MMLVHVHPACLLVLAVLVGAVVGGPTASATASATDSISDSISDSPYYTLLFQLTSENASPFHATPVEYGQFMFAATIEPDNTLFLVNLEDGREIWSKNMGSGRFGMRSSPVVDPVTNLVHVATDNLTYYAFDALNGTMAWGYTPGPKQCNDLGNKRPCEVYSTALLTDGLRIQGSEDGILRTFNAQTGEVVAAADIGHAVNGSPLLDASGDGYYVGADGDYFYHFPVGKTTPTFKTETEYCNGMTSKAALSTRDNLVFFGCYFKSTNSGEHANGTVYAIDATTGSVKWTVRKNGGIPIYSAGGDVVVIAGYNGVASAVDPRTGEVRWTNSALPAIWFSGFVGGFVADEKRQRVYGGTQGRYFFALELRTGKLVWQLATHKIVAGPLGPMLTADGSVLAIPTYKALIVLKLTDK